MIVDRTSKRQPHCPDCGLPYNRLLYSHNGTVCAYWTSACNCDDTTNHPTLRLPSMWTFGFAVAAITALTVLLVLLVMS